MIDAQDEYYDAVERLSRMIATLAPQYPRIHFEVFIHKVDSVSDDFRADTLRDIQQRTADAIADAKMDEHITLNVSFYLTSVFDITVYDAMSRVVQRQIPQLDAMENLINQLCAKSRIERVYLVDSDTKLYMCTNTTPTNNKSYETCSDWLDVIKDIAGMYTWNRPEEEEDDFVVDTDDDVQMVEGMCTMEKRDMKSLYVKEMNQYVSIFSIAPS